jgi:hypothetical protein
MNTKIKFSLILMLINFIAYSQLLKDSDVTFRNFKAYSKVGSNLSGNLIKSGETNTKFSVSSIEINTFIAFETTLLGGGEQVYIVSNVTKENKSEKLICNIECRNGQDPQKKIVKFIFEYIDNKLTKVYFPISTGIVEFY